MELKDSIKNDNQIIKNGTPSYYLDSNYSFIAWSKSFEEIIARPLGLKLGDHVAGFVDALKNKDEVYDRASKVFAVGEVPEFDTEKLIFQHKEFGKIDFQKYAFQLSDDSSVFWKVDLLPIDIEKEIEFFDFLENSFKD